VGYDDVSCGNTAISQADVSDVQALFG